MVSVLDHQGYKEAESNELLATFFAIFYVNDAYFASRDAEFFQRVLDIVVGLFAWVGLQTNTTKTQAMICIPGRIRTQLPVKSYRQMHCGQVTAAEWNARPVECRQWGKTMLASSLGRHLADVHDIYQSQMVAKELLEHQPPATYTVMHQQVGKLVCPFPMCEGILNNGWNLRCHFWDVHPMDLVVVLSEGKHRHCHQCGMQVNPFYSRHYTSKECRIGVQRKQQREAEVTSALALRQQFSVNGDVLERVEVFKYLGRLLAQDDDDIQAIRTQLRKARATWARVRQVLWSKNASPRVAAKFYKAVVQAALL